MKVLGASGLVIAILIHGVFIPLLVARQIEPDAKRTREIQQALVDHGHPVQVTGKWNHETRGALADIAKEHCWQTAHVPDARVLIILGLGNKHSNEWVTTQPPNRLEYPPSCPGTGAPVLEESGT